MALSLESRAFFSVTSSRVASAGLVQPVSTIFQPLIDLKKKTAYELSNSHSSYRNNIKILRHCKKKKKKLEVKRKDNTQENRVYQALIPIGN